MAEKVESKIEIFFEHNEPSHIYLPKELADKKNISGIYGPSNIKWVKDVDYSEPLIYLSDKNRKRIMKAYEHTTENLKWSFQIGDRLSEELFKEWFELYTKNVLSKNTGELRIQSNWFKTKDPERLRSIFIRDSEGKLIAGMLIEITNSKTISCSYRSHEYIHVKDSSVAHILELCLDTFAIENNFKIITRGADTNLYGVRLSPGLAEFKSNFGFKPTPLDQKSSYYPRVLLFLKPYENILTFIYSDKRKSITPTILDLETIEPFIIDKNVLLDFI